jgi:hypothetical protein
MAVEQTRRDEAVVRNEARFREQNERMKASNAAHRWVDPPVPDWSCECGWESCTRPIRVPLAEYEAVRRVPTRFLVAPREGHVAPEAERVVGRHADYWVVEKIGAAAAMSGELDPRSGGGSD